MKGTAGNFLQTVFLINHTIPKNNKRGTRAIFAEFFNDQKKNRLWSIFMDGSAPGAAPPAREGSLSSAT